MNPVNRDDVRQRRFTVPSISKRESKDCGGHSTLGHLLAYAGVRRIRYKMATGSFAGAMKLRYVIKVSVLVLLPTAHAEEFAQEDWRKLGQEATRILSEYIRIDTTNPPGNELEGVLFLKSVLDREGIPSEVLDRNEAGSRRGNLYARLRGSGRKRAIALVNHVDVVPVDRNAWTVDPFGGIVKDGYIWGRGALDMKGHAVAQLLALIAIKRTGIPLSRDIVFIANCDEELLGTKGAAVFVKSHRDLLKDVEYVLSEGIANRVESERVIHYSVVTGEKLNYSQRLTVRGTPSHASRPNIDNPVNSLITALNRLARFESTILITPETQTYFQHLAQIFTDDQRVWASDIRAAVSGPNRAKVIDWLKNDPTWHAHIRNTAQITVLKASEKTNVVPAEATAEVDIRILPGQDPETFI